MSASWVTFLFEAANFLLLAVVLGWFFFRPVRDAIERRRQEIENERQAATDARQQAERELADARARHSAFEGSLEELRQRVQREAEAERDRLLEEARARTRREREMLDQELVARRRAQGRSLARDAAFAAREIVVRLLQEIKGPEIEPLLCSAACRELEGLRSTGSLAPLVVESAAALEAEAFAALLTAAGVTATDASGRTDPELVAGVRVLTPQGLVDASVAGLAAQVEQVLLKRLESGMSGDD